MKRMYTEKIYGNMATVFHRTSISNLVNEIYTSGFKPGSGDAYGTGFYATYELSSQERDIMKKYGNLMVKFAVPIDNFFIFDYEQLLKSPIRREVERIPVTMPEGFDYTSEYFEEMKSTIGFLIQQCVYFKMNTSNVDWKLAYKILSYGRDAYTSNIAGHFYEKIPYFTKKCQGIIFTGQRDGKVLVAYNTNLIIPLSYRIDGEKDFESVERNMDYLRKWSKSKNTFNRYQEPLSDYHRIFNIIKTKKVNNKKIVDTIEKNILTFDAQYWKGFWDYLLNEYYDSSDAWEFIDDSSATVDLNNIFMELYEFDDQAYSYGYDNPEYFIFEKPEDGDEYSEEQKEEAAEKAEQEAMEEGYREFVNDIQTKSPLEISRNYRDIDIDDIFKFENVYQRAMLIEWVRRFIDALYYSEHEFEDFVDDVDNNSYNTYDTITFINDLIEKL